MQATRALGSGVPAFNDDIEATGAVALAALLGATRVPGVPPLRSQVFLFFGAGQVRWGCLCVTLRAHTTLSYTCTCACTRMCLCMCIRARCGQFVIE